MRRPLLALCLSSLLPAQEDRSPDQPLPGLASIPTTPIQASPRSDWLLAAPGSFPARLRHDPGSKELVLSNGLIRRVWRLQPDGACVAFDDLRTGRSMLRAVRPEAQLVADGEIHRVGGLRGQPNHAFLRPNDLATMGRDPAALHLVGLQHGPCQERFAWKRVRHHDRSRPWPPKGLHLRLDFAGAGLRVAVHYELYDDLPVIRKWLVVHNTSERKRTLQRLRVEELAAVERQSWVEARAGIRQRPPAYLHVETDFAFGGFNAANANRHVVHWRSDPQYRSQVNYKRETPCLLQVEPSYGPDQDLGPGGQLQSFAVFELVYDSEERERRGLSLRRMYRLLAPWTSENPLTHHLLSNDPARVRQAVDEAASVGFEAIILSFGSGFQLDNRDLAYNESWREVAAYAATKGIELGAYSLFSSRGVDKPHMIASPPGHKPTHGRCPAVTSTWGQAWLARVREFYRDSGFRQFENDGPYPGDLDTTPRPPLQKGLQDSRWVQGRMTNALYQDLRGMGIYINAPDYYFLSGSNKCGMGYREVNWSLPRADQVLHTRQNIYDGTWTKTPSMGWMFVPLSQYHGGGAAATVEPLDQHRDHYRRLLQSNLGLGVMAHFRGPRLFDTPRTQALVRGEVQWFKKYRAILESDLIHGRRADGRDLDWMLHANPQLQHKGMLLVYNPLPEPRRRRIRVNLYYTGLRDKVRVRPKGGAARTLDLDRRGWLELEVQVPAGGMTWYLCE